MMIIIINNFDYQDNQNEEDDDNSDRLITKMIILCIYNDNITVNLIFILVL